MADKSDEIATPPQRWPAWYALVTSWVWPATTTARMTHVSLLRAYGIHVISLVGILPVAMFLVALSEVRRRGEFATVFGEYLRVIGTAFLGILSDPTEGWFEFGIFLGLVELLFLLITVCACALGAGDESLGDSVRHALRRTRLHTPHVVAAVLFTGIILVEVDSRTQRKRTELYERFAQMHAPPVHPEDSNDKPAMEAYWAAQNDYRERQWDYSLAESLLLRAEYHFPLSVPLVVAAIGWFFWALYRGICAPRPSATLVRDPLCGSCGYNLTGQPPDSRCPECGTFVADSLHADPARSPAWIRRRQIGPWRAYVRTLVQGIRRPRELARHITLAAPRGDAMRFLTINAALCAAVLACAILVYRIAQPQPYFSHWRVSWSYRWGLNTMAIACPIMVLGVLWVTGLAALAGALIVRARDGRDILAWIGETIAYGSGYLVLWIVFACLWTFVVDALEDEWVWISVATGITQDLLRGAAWIIPNAVIAIGYILHTARGVRGVRYAWR